MNNDCFFRIAAAEHLGYIKDAVQRRAERLRNNTPTIRDLVRHLADVCGVYLVGSSSLGCYKIGYGASLCAVIGSHGFYPFKLDAIMWRETETDGSRELAEQLRAQFRAKSCRIENTSGEWFKLNDADLETLRTTFQFVSD